VYDGSVDPANAPALAILESFARLSEGPWSVNLGEDYLRAVERVEALPQNQAGGDKSWVEESRREFREHFARVRRPPRVP
jgi:hypothetical protein